MTLLSEHELEFLAHARTATMATTAPDGRPRLVPICFVVAEQPPPPGTLLYTPLDEKPKRADARDLARVRDLLVLPEVTLLVERWDEDWSRLAWLRIYGTGELLEPESREREEHARAVELLRRKYPQYAEHRLEGRPLIRIHPTRTVSWGDL